MAKKLQEVVKTTLCVFRRTIFGLKFFSKVLNRFGFSAENLAWFSNFYLRVHSWNSGRNNFLNFLFKIFSEFERIFFRLSAKKLQEVFKTTFYVCRGTVCGLIFFFIFWIVLDFLEKPLAWFSKFYLRVQSKTCGRINFFILLFRIFSEFERKTFRLSAKKLQEVVKTTFRVCGWTNFGLGIFLKCFEPFWIFCRNLWHGSQNSIYVSRVKIAEEMVFFVFLFRIFFDFWAKIFRLLAKELQEVDKTTLCVFRRTIFGLKFFSKVLSRFGFSSENLAWFSNFYLRVQRKNSGRNNFFILLFRFFSEFERNFFFRFLAKKLQEVVKTNFCVCRRTFFGLGIFFKMFWTVLDFLQKPLAWFSKFYLRVQSKNCGRNGFFCFSFQNFFRSLSERLSDFRPKNFKKLSKLHSACADEQNLAWEFFWNVLNRFGFSAETFGMVLKLLSSCPQ